MLPKSNRLSPIEVRQVLRLGRRVMTPPFQLVFKKNAQLVSRFTTIVSTHIDKRATARNRLKRLIREAIHHLLPLISRGFDGVVIVKGKPKEISLHYVEDLVRRLFSEAHLL